MCGGDLTYAWRIPIGRPGLFMAMAFVIVSSVPCAHQKRPFFPLAGGGTKDAAAAAQHTALVQGYGPARGH